MQTNTRYMVDIQTYKQLHGDTEVETDGHKTELEAGLMENDTPPSDTFLLQLPRRILGFGLHDKKWRNLYAEYIQPVQWNKLAFDRLVLNPDKKLLIKAMVQEHVQINTSADIIEGKGNGLIILLHGGPGTGKTLTAESVAELAERPLYRVTGGDVGTEPEAIEKYLESVLYIGTTWKAGKLQLYSRLPKEFCHRATHANNVAQSFFSTRVTSSSRKEHKQT